LPTSGSIFQLGRHMEPALPAKLCFAFPLTNGPPDACHVALRLTGCGNPSVCLRPKALCADRACAPPCSDFSKCNSKRTPIDGATAAVCTLLEIRAQQLVAILSRRLVPSLRKVIKSSRPRFSRIIQRFLISIVCRRLPHLAIALGRWRPRKALAPSLRLRKQKGGDRLIHSCGGDSPGFGLARALVGHDGRGFENWALNPTVHR
jgi:hypothetical protein